MSVMRFTGVNSRDAMRQVREALGDEALILANRRVDDGVEILAMAESAAPGGSDDPQRHAQTNASAPPAAGQGASSAFEAMSARLLEEMQDMRALLSREQAPAALGGLREQLQHLLLEAGFRQELAGEVVSALPEELVGQDMDARAMSWLHRQLVNRLEGLDDEDAFLDRAGIVALIGPTGIGKTTTTAKLAARYVMRHGTRPVALVTTDSFRIGAHEQLRIYSRLLDVPMYALNADQPVSDLLERMRGKSWVIIDTVGMSQRDHRVIEQVAHLRGGDAPVRLVLLLNAASQPETLEEVVIRYRQAAQAAGAELSDCIITKQDEAGRLAPVLDIVMRHGLRLLFVSHGQRVPEDMSVADVPALVDRALEARVAMAQSTPRQGAVEAPARSPNLLGQGRRLSSTLLALRQRLTGFQQLEAVWDLLGLPAVVQQRRLESLLSSYPASEQALGMLWSERRRVKGERWSMPDIAIDPEGGWLALPLLQHRQVAGQQARLEDALQRLAVSVHLLQGLPDGEAADWLEEKAITWCSQVRGSQRVEHAGERLSLSTLGELAEPLGDVACRFRGSPGRLALSSLPVAVALKAGKGVQAVLVQAWLGDVRDTESGRVLAKRYWVTPARLGRDPQSLLVAQLQGDALPQLTRRAWQRLAPSELGEVRPDVRLLMASGLATVAAHLDLAEDEAAMDLRAELLGLSGGRQRRRDVALLESLMQLFMVRDAIRHLGLGERESG
ncbi:flagellar biosynthesis protein FlhF [Halomonas chromatireducens]|uniref:Flagellar biosynthesis protein FlhF n=1 Tax=Halomonas chromatireducens TaxID=507626 RepID=A0A125R0E5_9GAMM|nr:flagellar biosynthesis protein FlhF [Halomonas chromatireducens]AMD01809.1 Flagellar biosynthesis protein FlhF [Halomonas chromatireducens]